jgi:outer membrane protein insertion porin family
MRRFLQLLFSFIFIGLNPLLAQITLGEIEIDYNNPKEYEIASIELQGAENLDQGVLKMLTGLSVGEKVQIPGERISRAIQALWGQGLFADISVAASKLEGNRIFILFNVQERPRLSKFSIVGVNKSDADNIREKIQLIRGKPVNENLIVNTRQTVKEYFIDKGYLDPIVKITTMDDTLTKGKVMKIFIDKNRRVKINEIVFQGNNNVNSGKLKRKMKGTKENPWWSIFTTSKMMEENYEEDKKKILAYYLSKGYKDVNIRKDTLYRFNDKTLNVEIYIDEGNQYFFRNINWIGNSKYTSEQLSAVLGIKKGDIYNQATLEQNLFMNQNEQDVSSLYMNDGHLFFQVTPVEVFVENDSVDIEMRIYEGKQATINSVTVTGNDKTNDHVILREIRTRPGQLFRRSDIIRSQRELMQLGYFDQEKMGVNPVPNPADGTVDIEYIVEERPSDQIELSGGWGAGRIIGTLGIAFNNFSAKKFFKKGAWAPLPSGDGQRLSLRAQSNGRFLQAYNASFTEPWLGGKKPNSLSVSLFKTIINSNGLPKNDPNRAVTDNTGITIGLGRRLKWPDDFFILQNELSYQYFVLQNSPQFIINNGRANNLSFRTTLSRNSIDAPIYPRSGSSVSLSLQFTPPYSLFNNLPEDQVLSDDEKFRWTEFHKWKFDAQWFNKLAGNLVLMARANFGFIGFYNPAKGISPFERFSLGGAGLTGFNFAAQFLGTEIIGLRGYDDNSLSAAVNSPIYNRYTLELRYPVSLNPSATVFGLAFLEGGDAWDRFKDFTPFNIKRSGGFGVRVFLPMFGLLGLDWGYRFDDVTRRPQDLGMRRSQFHFIIGQSFN